MHRSFILHGQKYNCKNCTSLLFVCDSLPSFPHENSGIVLVQFEQRLTK